MIIPRPNRSGKIQHVPVCEDCNQKYLRELEAANKRFNPKARPVINQLPKELVEKSMKGGSRQ